jgi:hypothetical protein
LRGKENVKCNKWRRAKIAEISINFNDEGNLKAFDNFLKHTFATILDFILEKIYILFFFYPQTSINNNFQSLDKGTEWYTKIKSSILCYFCEFFVFDISCSLLSLTNSSKKKRKTNELKKSIGNLWKFMSIDFPHQHWCQNRNLKPNKWHFSCLPLSIFFYTRFIFVIIFPS